MQLRLNISIQISQVRYPSGGFEGVCLPPCVEGNVDTHCRRCTDPNDYVYYGS